MRPNKLIMNAFGPYAGREVIDFTSVTRNGIFLITGPTGAGKTTIFDAICYALYGRASGEARQNETFKSDFAPDTELCSVTLTFELRGKEYTVFRQPQQQKRGSKGGMTLVPSKAELTFPDGKVVSGGGDVNARIVELLGISPGQFKQIVMLAQGEFRRLLEASNEERQEIFRRIFSTDTYERFTQELGRRTKLLGDRIEKEQAAVAAYASGLDCSDHPELRAMAEAESVDLDALLPALERQLAEDRAALEEAEQEWAATSAQRARLDLADTIATNRRLEELGDLRRKAAVLLGRKDYIAEQKQRLKFIRDAQQVSKTDDMVRQLSGQAAEYQRDMNDCQQRLPALMSTMKQSQSALHTAKAQEEAKQTLIECRAGLEQSLSTIERIGRCRGEMAALRAEADELAVQELVLQRMRERAGLLVRRRDAGKRLDQVENLLLLCGQTRDLSAEFQRVKERYITQYDRFLSAQAGILAKSLDDALPCPVCGSLHHPSPALLPEDVPQQAELDVTRARLDELSAQLSGLEVEIRAVCRQINFLGDVFRFSEDEVMDHLGEVCEAKLETDELLERLDAQIVALEEEVTRRSGVKPESRLDDEIAVLDEVALVQGKILKAGAELDGKQRQIDELIDSLGERGENPEQVIEEIKTVSAEIAEIDRKIAACTQEFIEAKSEYDQLCKTIELARGKLFNLNTQKNLAQNQFHAELNRCGLLTRERYEEYRRVAGEAAELEEMLSQYQVACTAATTELNTLDAQLVGKSYRDVAALAQQADEMDARLEALSQRQVALSARLQVNSQAAEQMRRRWEGLAGMFGRYQDLSELYRLSSGNNAQRLSFESYVLSSYFDDIIRLANVRLDRMTGGRYALRRRLEREKYGRASGLSLEILDSYSGRARHVNTLSGGESFKTALALALGLADIVQMYAGGVEIDTMFIDEGFGTLDAESLDSAVQALSSLGGEGHVVGIVSHVAELKERIPTRIAVDASKSGSTCRIIL